jgi:hypothetical protein
MVLLTSSNVRTYLSNLVSDSQPSPPSLQSLPALPASSSPQPRETLVLDSIPCGSQTILIVHSSQQPVSIDSCKTKSSSSDSGIVEFGGKVAEGSAMLTGSYKALKLSNQARMGQLTEEEVANAIAVHTSGDLAEAKNLAAELYPYLKGRTGRNVALVGLTIGAEELIRKLVAED